MGVCGAARRARAVHSDRDAGVSAPPVPVKPRTSCSRRQGTTPLAGGRQDGVLQCSEFGCAISSETLRRGTHSWEIRLHRTDGAVGIGVCTERDGFCLDIGDGRWYRGVMNGEMWVTNHRNEVADADSDADAPWCADSGWSGSVLVVTFDCGTGKLSVGRKDGILRSVSHVFGELASMPVAPFVFSRAATPARSRQRVCSSIAVVPADLLAPVPEPMDSDEEAAQAVADFVRNNKERRRSQLDSVSFGRRPDARVGEGANQRPAPRRRGAAARGRTRRGPLGRGAARQRWQPAAQTGQAGCASGAGPEVPKRPGGRDAADAIDVDDEPRSSCCRP